MRYSEPSSPRAFAVEGDDALDDTDLLSFYHSLFHIDTTPRSTELFSDDKVEVIDGKEEKREGEAKDKKSVGDEKNKDTETSTETDEKKDDKKTEETTKRNLPEEVDRRDRSEPDDATGKEDEPKTEEDSEDSTDATDDTEEESTENDENYSLIDTSYSDKNVGGYKTRGYKLTTTDANADVNVDASIFDDVFNFSPEDEKEFEVPKPTIPSSEKITVDKEDKTFDFFDLMGKTAESDIRTLDTSLPDSSERREYRLEVPKPEPTVKPTLKKPETVTKMKNRKSGRNVTTGRQPVLPPVIGIDTTLPLLGRPSSFRVRRTTDGIRTPYMPMSLPDVPEVDTFSLESGSLRHERPASGSDGRLASSFSSLPSVTPRVTPGYAPDSTIDFTTSYESATSTPSYPFSSHLVSAEMRPDVVTGDVRSSGMATTPPGASSPISTDLSAPHYYSGETGRTALPFAATLPGIPVSSPTTYPPPWLGYPPVSTPTSSMTWGSDGGRMTLRSGGAVSSPGKIVVEARLSLSDSGVAHVVGEGFSGV